MKIFFYKSALQAILDADVENQQKARKKWEELISQNAVLVCTNYILVEAFALIQHRLGMEALCAFQEAVVPLLTIEWVNESVHQLGVMGVLSAAKRKLSLVDCVSFDIMRQLGIKSVFAFDRHFKEQGFECIP